MVQAGELIERKYRLKREIGQGGMAVVWEAEHTTLGSSVAVKFVRAEGRDADRLAERFLNEARAAAKVRHRHVVEILDFGRTDELPFMVMELLPGRSLEDALRAEDSPHVDDRIRFVAEALSGLAAIHDEGLIHRDLKPANIFITHDADGEFAKILDFGLSRTMGDPVPGVESMLAGTPEYMSPEQARGQALDHTTDVYSVGVVLYELISGELPFQNEDLNQLLDAICTDAPPSLRTLPGMPSELADLVERAMHRKSDRRYTDARAMREALLATRDVVSELRRPITIRNAVLSRSTCAVTLAGTMDEPRVGSLISTLPPKQQTSSDPPKTSTRTPVESASDPVDAAVMTEPVRRSWRWAVAVVLLAVAGGVAYAFTSDEPASPQEERSEPAVPQVAIVEEPETPEVPSRPASDMTATFVDEVDEPPVSPMILSMRARMRSLPNPTEEEPEDLVRDPGF